MKTYRYEQNFIFYCELFYIYVYLCIYVYIYVYMFIHMCVYVHMCSYLYIYEVGKKFGHHERVRY